MCRHCCQSYFGEVTWWERCGSCQGQRYIINFVGHTTQYADMIPHPMEPGVGAA